MRLPALGALLCMIGVIAGAFGAHALRPTLSPASMAIYQTGVQYHLLHSLAIVALGAYGLKSRTTSWLFVAGIFLFSGSLYALALTGITWLGAITPLGGVCFIVGWGLLAGRMLRPDNPAG